MSRILIALVLIVALAATGILYSRYTSEQQSAATLDAIERDSSQRTETQTDLPAETSFDLSPVQKGEDEWRELLTDIQYEVTREHGTEMSFSGEYCDLKSEGMYDCVGCGLPLFSSDTKYKSGTGWPSFWQPYRQDHIETSEDNSLLYTRIEVHCRRCQGHLGHVFSDGPEPTGLRYCLNSAALKFVPRDSDSGVDDPPTDD